MYDLLQYLSAFRHHGEGRILISSSPRARELT
jgi:hypothetical protein